LGVEFVDPSVSLGFRTLDRGQSLLSFLLADRA
jgi:hypothetical protein